MLVLVTGGRTYKDDVPLYEALWRTLQGVPDGDTLTLVHGHAKGADSIARDWARASRREQGKPVREQGFRAEWWTLGAQAGPIRNARMVAWCSEKQAQGERVLVIACPGGRGTADCVAKAMGAGLRVLTLTEILEP